jgi:hypothetical protein
MDETSLLFIANSYIFLSYKQKITSLYIGLNKRKKLEIRIKIKY